MKFQLPESLDGLSIAQLSELQAAAVAERNGLLETPDGELSDEQLSHIEYCLDGEEKLTEAISGLETAATQRSERLAAARSRATQAASAGGDGDGDAGDGDGDGGDGDGDGDGDGNLTASGSVVSGLARRNAGTATLARPSATIVAAPDVPGFAQGADLQGFPKLTSAFLERARGFPSKPVGTGGRRSFSRFGVATISRGLEAFDGLTDTLVGSDHESVFALMDAASKEKRLPEGNLVAAGGWCAPSEIIYDLCERETTAGLLDVPEVQISRGGIRWTQGPDFSEIFNNIGFCQTEAQAEAGELKDCYDVPCPEFEEARLDACGICIRAGILTNVGYPELVQRWIRGAMIAHQHKMSIKVLNEMRSQLPLTAIAGPLQELTASLLGFLEVLIQSQREAFRMELNATMEVVAPAWLRGAIRAEMAFRTGTDNFMNVSDEEINAWFARRGARVQWIYNFQPLATSEATGCRYSWPTTVELLVYPAGTFVKGVEDVIRMDAVYDTAGLQENTYTAVFFEEGVLVAKMCHGGCRFSIPVCISGVTAAAVMNECQILGPVPASS